MARVLNKYKDNCAGAVNIMRPSKWGNPFVLGVDGSRDEVLAKFNEWFRNNKALQAHKLELQGKDLMCCCAPKGCHGDILLEWANGE